ncbi:6-phosphofructokinase [Arcticibacter eurypsychrophilus]|uniref:6-phosphofructokinase n=1 Tax=Arcticibacter eurypsychrophilus TaxID=1434752 RepID=UPI00084DA6CB|nr:6-phosphofructokinase [Arcticibacter eurypsychrophilus]
MDKIKNIGVFTSGGDAPGMNAAIRSVVRTALHYDIQVTGIMKGFEGLITSDFMPMNSKSVANIIQRGGTILKTGKSDAFLTKEGRQIAYDNLVRNNIDALVAIGGEGTFKGANIFSKEFNVPIIGMPGTIDNDLIGTDFTIGYDTATNTVINAVDKIRDTAESHDRLFIVEVMGRDSGLIALRSGIGVGAEAILIPESKTDIDVLFNTLSSGRKDKASKIIIVAEGEEIGGFEIAELIKEKFPNYDTRLSILGHIQRGGRPSCMDRVLASRLGVAAVEALLNGKKCMMVGLMNQNVVYTPFDNAIKHLAEADPNLLKIVRILS